MRWMTRKTVFDHSDEASLSSISTTSFSTLGNSSHHRDFEISFVENDFSENASFSNEKNVKSINHVQRVPKSSSVDELLKTLSLNIDGDAYEDMVYEDAVKGSFLRVVGMLTDRKSTLSTFLKKFADDEEDYVNGYAESDSEATDHSFLRVGRSQQRWRSLALSTQSDLSNDAQTRRSGDSTILSEYSDLSSGRKQRRWSSCELGHRDQCHTPTRRRSLDSLPRIPSRTPLIETPQEKKKSVRFDTVNVRLYEITLGDNPTRSNGPSISLGWKYESCLPVSIETWEIDRSGSDKGLSGMVISKERREQMAKEMGFSDQEIHENSKIVQKINFERMQTVNLLAVEALEQGKGKPCDRWRS